MSKFTNTPVAATPTIPQDRVDQILNDLIAKAGPENLAQIPETLERILTVLKANMPVPAPKVEIKRKRKPNANGYTPPGWPAGVGRKEYLIWKEMQEQKGVTENLNPHEYKRQRDGGTFNIESAAGGIEPVSRGDQDFDDEPDMNSSVSEIEQELFAHAGAVPDTNSTYEDYDATATLSAELDKPAKASGKSNGKKGKTVNAGKGVESVLPA